jgi:DNA-directed RNA polymerase subunit RPC12/RpoP
MYPYTCISCGTHFELNKRVTITKRRCSYCNFPIYTQEIDRQANERRKKEQEETIIALVISIPLLIFYFIFFQ